MAKWNRNNFKIADKLYRNGEKPIVLDDIGSYFDNIADYSNGSFFSKDTIDIRDIRKYENPKISRFKKFNGNLVLGMGKDKNGEEFEIALFNIETRGGLIEVNKATLFDAQINSLILDGYWERLSKVAVLNGAGALKLFIDESEKARKEYLANKPVEKPGFFSRLLGLIGFKSTENKKLDLKVVDNSVDNSNDKNRAGDMLLSPTGMVTKQTVSPMPVVTKTSNELVTIVSPIPSPSKSPMVTPKVSVAQVPLSNIKLSTVKRSGHVVVNEIAWAGTEASATDEWIELYNSENEAVDISGWRLVSDDESPSVTLPESTILQANSYFLIERTDDNTISSLMSDFVTSFGQGGLNNSGEYIRLFDSEGKIVDMAGNLGVAWFFGGLDGKFSMERVSSNLLGSEPSSWKKFSGNPKHHDANGGLVNGTPKEKNSLPTVTFNVESGSLPPLTTPTTVSLGSASPPQVTPVTSPTSTPTPKSGDTSVKVVINEIAWMGTSSSSSDEWIELYNVTPNQVDLTGWTLKSLTGSSPDPNIESQFSGKTIFPFGYFLLERTDDSTVSDTSADIIYTGSLLDTGEVLELKDAGGNLQDKISNTGSWYAGDKNMRSSMERVDPKKNGDEPANWTTNNGVIKNGIDVGGNPINGTPKTKNSVYVPTKPSVISDLDVVGIDGNFGSVKLTWLTPNDLDTLPGDLIYDLRYATQSLSLVDVWEYADKVPSVSLPDVAISGTPASTFFNVGGGYNEKWYFAVKTKLKTCPAGDCEDSDVSNMAENMTNSALSTSWGMFGKDNLHTSFASINGVVPQGLEVATISWEFNVGIDNSVGQPTVSDKGNVFLGSSDGKFHALDSSGVQKWQQTTLIKPGAPVVLADESTYFGHENGGSTEVTALNPDGSLKWAHYGAGTSPVTLAPDGSVYFSSWDGKLNSVRSDGSLNWVVNGPFGNLSPIVLNSGKVISAARVSGTPHYFAYDLFGNQLWDTAFPEGYDFLPSHPSFDVETETIYSAVGHYLVRISEAGELNKNTIDQKGIATSMVSVSTNNLTFAMDYSWLNPASGSQVIVLDKATKEIKWRFKTDARINSQIAIDKVENVYFSTQNGKVYGVKSDGVLMWLIDMATSSPISPILGEKAVFWGYGSRLVKIEAR